jgi:hypothetical protein
MLNMSNDTKIRKQFDIDLEFGKQWETHVDELFSGAKTCEVKTERDKWSNTGNICIEIESYNKPSGLHATTSDLWVHNLVKEGELVASIVIPTEVLKKIIATTKNSTIYGGDNRASKLILLNLNKLIEYFKGI